MQGGSTGIGYGLKYQVNLPKSHSLSDCRVVSRISFIFVNKYLYSFLFLQARCISDVKADTDHTSFLTGTLSLKEENEVRFFFFFILPPTLILLALIYQSFF